MIRRVWELNLDLNIKVHIEVWTNYIFFGQLERALLSPVWDNETPRRCKMNWYMGGIVNNLEDSDQVIIISDKTDSFRIMDTKKYMTMVN